MLGLWGPKWWQQFSFMLQKTNSKIPVLTGSENLGCALMQVLCFHLSEKDWTSNGLLSSSA